MARSAKDEQIAKLTWDRRCLINALKAAIGYDSSVTRYDEFQKALRLAGDELRAEILAKD